MTLLENPVGEMYEEEYDRPYYEEAFDSAITFALEGLKAERVMVVFSGNGRVHGLDATKIWLSEPLSMSTLRRLVESAGPTMLVDAVETNPQQTSVVLCAAISLIFVPVRSSRDEICGFVYLDRPVTRGPFGAEHLKQVKALVAGRVEPTLKELDVSRRLSWGTVLKTCWI